MRVLVLAPHTDDAELGCGATITKHLQNGDYVFVLVLCVQSPDIPPGILKDEFVRSMQIIGVRFYQTNVFTMRKLSEVRQFVLDALIKDKRDVKPDRVYLPSPHDLHQDHRVVADEGIRAFKDITTLGYELPWNNLKFYPQAFVKLNHDHLTTKLQALKAYESQKEKKYMNPLFIESLARMRGGQVGAEFAEAFEVIRWVQD
jgi:LmbE family N-acetylglucosaminyl deacetylase